LSQTRRRSRRKPKPKGKNKKFYRTKKFYIIVSVFVLIFISGIVVNSMIRAPEIPVAHTPISMMPRDTEEDDISYTPPTEEEDSEEDDDPQEEPETIIRKPDFYTFVIFGLDEGFNSDTLMVVSFDAANHVANLIWIPRDTYVNVDREIRKINSAYGYGYIRNFDEDEAAAQLKKEVTSLIGFMPDYFIGVHLNAFVRLVDAIGGVEVYVPMNMHYSDRCRICS